MLSALDDGVGNVTAVLKENGYMDDTRFKITLNSITDLDYVLLAL